MIPLIAFLTVFGIPYLLYVLAEHAEEKRLEKDYPNAEEWLRMKFEPGWSPKAERIRKQKEYEQQLDDYMRQDLSRSWEQYMNDNSCPKHE